MTNQPNFWLFFLMTIWAEILCMSYPQPLLAQKELIQKYLKEGNAKFKERKLDEAAECYQKILTLDSTNAVAYHNLGNIKMVQNSSLGSQKNYNAILFYYNKALQYNTQSADSYYARASVWYLMDSLNKSLDDLAAAIKINSSFSTAYILEGRIYLKKGYKNKACASWDKASLLGNTSVYEEIKQHCDGVEREINTIKKGVTATEYFDLGKKKFKQRDYQGAIQDFSFAINLDSRFANAFFYRGLAKQQLGLLKAACLDWRKAYNLNSKDAQQYIKDYCYE